MKASCVRMNEADSVTALRLHTNSVKQHGQDFKTYFDAALQTAFLIEIIGKNRKIPHEDTGSCRGDCLAQVTSALLQNKMQNFRI